MRSERNPQQQQKPLKQALNFDVMQEEVPFEFFLRPAPAGVKRARNKSFLRNSSKKSNLAQ